MATADISTKPAVARTAIAEGRINLKEGTVAMIRNREIKKGDVLTVAETAAIAAVKMTPEMLVFCHQIPIEHVDVKFELGERSISTKVMVKATAKTGVEMEALCGVCAALATIWDMTKYLEKDEAGQYPGTSITDIQVIEKTKR